MTTQQPLGEIAEIVRGISFPKEAKSLEPRSGDVACLRTTNVQRVVEWDDLWFVPSEHVKRAEQFVQPGDVLISTANSYELVGKVALVSAVPRQATLGAFISLIRARPGIDPRFLYHQLAWGRTQSRIRETASTTTNISNVSTKKLAALELDVPPLDDQRRIVAEIEKQFSRLDEAVANLKRVKANLKRYKAAVLKAAVEGRLVPTEAELARRERRGYEAGEQLLRRILETRRSQWKGKGKCKEPAAPDITGLPKLPDGWTWATVDQLGDVQLGKMLDRQKNVRGQELPYLRNINVRWGWVDTADLLTMFFEEDELEHFGLEQGDVLVCEGGEPGRAAVWTGQPASMKYQKALHRVRLRKGFVPSLLVFLLEHLATSGRLERWFTGSTIKHFTRESFLVMPVPLPPISEQQRVVAEVDRRLSIIRELGTEVDANLKRAQALRQAVLVRAFAPVVSGVVREEETL